MKNWPLKRKFGVLSALLAIVALVGSVLMVRPLVYRHQLRELDRELEENAAEIMRDIENFSGAPKDLIRSPIDERLIPLALRRRYYQIFDPEGKSRIKSPNLRQQELGHLSEGGHTLVINGRNARIGVFVHGMITICVGTTLGTIERIQADLLNATLIVTPIVGLLVFMLGWWLANRSLRPVAALSAAAQRISAQNPEDRLPLPATRDEIFSLTQVLNASFERLQKSYTSAARFSADASHQLKTPITIIRAGVDELAKSPRLSATEQEEINQLRKQTRRLSSLVDDLLLLAQIDAGRLSVSPQSLDLMPFILAAIDDLAAPCEEKHLNITANLPDSLMVLADERRIGIILQNLTENAVKYAPPDSTVHISAGNTADAAWLRIRNSGEPIPPEKRQHLFERFYRANAGENIKGHGLGLNISRSLALAQNGTLELVQSDDAGTEFMLTMPLHNEDKAPREARIAQRVQLSESDGIAD